MSNRFMSGKGLCLEGVMYGGGLSEGFCPERVYVQRELCMEGVMSEFFLSVQHIKHIEMAILVVIYLM